jgi:hypothetical protein
MTGRSARWALLLVTVLSAPLAAAANRDSSVRIAAVHAPAGTDARARAALSESLHRYLLEAQLAESLRPYTVSPSLTQLRRYVEGSKQAKLVCMVDLALSDMQGQVVASVRGSATTRGASSRETIDAAARAAVTRLPGALQALNDSRNSPTQVAGTTR